METKAIQRVSGKEVNLIDLFSVLWLGKWKIASISFLFAVLSVFYSLTLPDIYRSEVTLAPAADSSSLKIPGQLGGLAALAGVNLGGSSEGNKTKLALEIMKSREFISRFINANDLFVPFMAAKGWDRQSGRLVIDEEIYNIETKQWVRPVVPPFEAKPSVLETYERFMKSISIAEEKSSGIVKIGFEYYSPELAKTYLDMLVIAINEEMRKRDLTEAQKSVEYLEKQISKTNISDFRTMLYSLIEEQTKTLMLANVRQEYVFKTVDPAVSTEKKMGPKRSLIVVLGFMAGFIISILTLLFFNFIANLRQGKI